MSTLRVLLVDDEEELVSALEERLQLRGIEATGVTRGADALEMVAARDFDVVVVDVKMPDMSGLEVMRKIKGRRPELPVILFTGHGSTKDSQLGMEEGAYDYLAKPIKIEVLVEKIEAAAASGK